MSDTPRTDKHFEGWGVAGDYDIAARSLSEQLERELAAMTKRADEMERLKEHNAQMFYRIERELDDLKAQHAWRPIETAPKGSVTENCGERGVSKWFIGLLDNGERLQMRRLPSTFGYDFETPDATYYAAFRVVGWQPLPEPPKGSDE